MAGEITQLLHELRDGDRQALNRLVPLVYRELKSMAHRQLGRRPAGVPLDTTTLVHEAYLKLVDQSRADWKDRTHFLAVAATAMRHLLIDHARRRASKKRGGEASHTSLDEGEVGPDSSAEQLVALNEALEELARIDARLARLVELRYFGGLTIAETARALEVSEPTVKREWQKARALLYRMLHEEPASDGTPICPG